MAATDAGMPALIRRSAGFSMTEVLVTMLIALVGLLGIAALQAQSHIAELEAQQRAQALIMLNDIADRMIANQSTLSCFTFTTNTTAGTPFIGVAGAGHASLAPCAASTSAYNTAADQALAAIDDMLEGSAETAGGTNAGAMIGARACISYDATTELPAQPGTGLYTIVVSWQGISDLVVPAANCANGLYGSEAKRRAVSMSFRMADLL